MTYSCTICFEPLVSSSGPISALVCGHTFHKLCINRWINVNSSSKCPLCKTPILKSKIISPIFLSDDNAETAVAESSDTHEKIAKLKKNNKELKSAIGSLKQRACDSKEEITHLHSELSRVRNQRSYVKIIKRVVELDNDLSSEYMQEYLRKVKSLPFSNLYVHVGALRARQMRAEEEIYKMTSLYENKKKENEKLQQKMEQLQSHIRSMEDGNGMQGRVNNFEPPERRPNVVILDSDTEDGDQSQNEDRFSVGQELAAEKDESQSNEVSEDDAGLLLYENTSQDEVFSVEEHVPSISRRPFKRANVFGYDETPSPRPKKIIRIDLTDDDDA